MQSSIPPDALLKAQVWLQQAHERWIPLLRRFRPLLALVVLGLVALLVWDSVAPLLSARRATAAFNQRDGSLLASEVNLDSVAADYFEAFSGHSSSGERAVSLSVRPEIMAHLKGVISSAISSPSKPPLAGRSVSVRLRERWSDAGRFVGISVKTPTSTVPGWLRLRRHGLGWTIVGVDSAMVITDKVFEPTH